jgi:hypothetical protein
VITGKPDGRSSQIRPHAVSVWLVADEPPAAGAADEPPAGLATTIDRVPDVVAAVEPAGDAVVPDPHAKTRNTTTTERRATLPRRVPGSGVRNISAILRRLARPKLCRLRA